MEKLKAFGDNEMIKKKINRMILEFKAKQAQSLFTVWAKKSIPNQNSIHHLLPTTEPVKIATDSIIMIDDSCTSQ